MPVPTYGRCFASLVLGLAPFFLIMGIAAIFGANTVTANGQYAHGVGGLVVAIILNVVFAALLAGLQKFGFLILDPIRRDRTQVED